MQVLDSKEKGQRNSRLTEPMAFCASFGPVPQRIEEPTTNRLVVGWNPTRSARLNSPTRSANYPWGLTSGFRQRQGFNTHCHFVHFARRKQGRNDVPVVPDEPQLSDRSREIWETPQWPTAFPLSSAKISPSAWAYAAS